MDRAMAVGGRPTTGAVIAGQETMTEQQRIQQQLQLFQNSLPKVNQIAYQMLLNEIVPLSVSVEKKLIDYDSDLKGYEDENKETGEMLERLHINPPLDPPSHKLCRDLFEADEEEHEKVLERLRSIGFQIGNKVTELLVFTNNPNLHFKDMDLLAVMKFICRDVWKQMFGKQIDNLKTNHRGTFYLFDYEYRPIQPFSLSDDSDEEELKMAKPFLEIPMGVIKGVLSSLGYSPDEVVCLASYVDRPEDRPKATFHKGVSFHVQVNMQ